MEGRWSADAATRTNHDPQVVVSERVRAREVRRGRARSESQHVTQRLDTSEDGGEAVER